MKDLNIEINGESVGESVFSVFEKIALYKIREAESRQEVQRTDHAIERDAAKIAGKLTDDLYRSLHECL